MEKRIDITKILRVIAMFSLVFFLFACGTNDDVTSAIDDPDCGEIPSEDTIEEQHRDCWQASVIGTIYKTTGKLTMSMYDKLTQGAMALMMVGFAIWLSLRMLKHMSSFTEESPAEVWTEVVKKFFVCLVCGILASSTTGVLFVLNSLIFPLYNAFLELGSAMIKNVAINGKEVVEYSGRFFLPFSGEIEAKYDIVCKTSGLTQATIEDGFPNEPQQMMECLACAIGERLNFGIKLGWVVMAQKGVMAFVCGIILLFSFVFVKLGFAFYLVDTIFRFAMMVMLLPLLIMGYAFKPTAGWTKKGFIAILNSAGFMACIAIVMITILAATQQILVEQKEIIEDKGSFSEFSVPFLMLLLIAFLTISSLGVAKSIVDKLVGKSGDANFQKRAGKALMALGKWAGGLAVGAVWKVALENSEKLRKFKAGADAAKAKMNSWAGRK